jgi:G3E family GTPase
VAWTFFREQFLGCFRFGGIVTVADVLNFTKMNDEALEVVLQIERADYLYISKTNQVPIKQVGAFEELLKELSPNARPVRDTDPNWLSLLFDFGGDEHTLKELHEHKHDHAEHFQSLAIRLDDFSVSLDDMEELFEKLPKTVFRAKAGFQDAKSGKTYVMHSVCGRVEFYETNLKIAAPVTIFIGKGFDKKELETNLKHSLHSQAG